VDHRQLVREYTFFSTPEYRGPQPSRLRQRARHAGRRPEPKLAEAPAAQPRPNLHARLHPHRRSQAAASVRSRG